MWGSKGWSWGRARTVRLTGKGRSRRSTRDGARFTSTPLDIVEYHRSTSPILHVENYAAMVRRRFEGGGLVTAKFVMRADDVQPVEVIKEYEDAEKGEVLACFEALTSLRSLLMSKD